MESCNVVLIGNNAKYINTKTTQLIKWAIRTKANSISDNLCKKNDIIDTNLKAYEKLTDYVEGETLCNKISWSAYTNNEHFTMIIFGEKSWTMTWYTTVRARW